MPWECEGPLSAASFGFLPLCLGLLAVLFTLVLKIKGIFIYLQYKLLILAYSTRHRTVVTDQGDIHKQ